MHMSFLTLNMNLMRGRHFGRQRMSYPTAAVAATSFTAAWRW
jgi:hypothetical protein